MKCFLPPYEGDEPFAFFSYCHADEATVFPIIERLILEGFRVWYDDGIHPGDDWPEVVGERLFNCSVCIAGISPASAQSHNCKNERTFVVNNNKPLIPVILEDFRMSHGTRVQISAANYINFFDYAENEEAFYAKLKETQVLIPCRETDHKAKAENLLLWREHKQEYLCSKPGKEPAPIDIDLLFSAADDSERDMEEKKRKHRVKPTIKPKQEVMPKPEEDPEIPHENIPEEKETEDTRNALEDTIDEKYFENTIVIRNEESYDPGDTIVLKAAYKPTLAYLVRMKTGEIFPMRETDISIGFDERQVAVAIRNNTISRHHADIVSADARFFLQDNDSTNGTFYGGKQLGEEQVELREIDEFALSDELFLFVSGESRKILSDKNKMKGIGYLKAVDTNEIRLLNNEPFFLDRTHPWGAGVLADRSVSRVEHAQIVCEDNEFFIMEINSKNGTFVNEEKLRQGEKKKLSNGNTITIAHTRFLFSYIIFKQRQGV